LRSPLAAQLRSYRDGQPNPGLERLLVDRMMQRRADRAQQYRGRSDPETLEYENILRRDPCSYLCGCDATCTDHIMPRIEGGPDHWSNFTASCQRHNGFKGSKSLLEYLLAQLAR